MASGPSIVEQVKKFQALQEERVLTYKLFEEGFQAYLRGAPHYNFPIYRQLVHEITQTFKNISSDVIDIIESLKNQNKNIIGTLMEQIQNEEQLKLELTAKLQFAEQNTVDHPHEELHKTEVTDLRQRIKSGIQQINEYLEELKFECEDLYTENDCER
ncbi:required for excision 1-B domain-containing protein-like [Gigantopelta aegis]|uniref:required for excision 1-B domain-containing protein-like n=1 Tax=Gigantopelta aegis TaxID=1735272 RepID=UPI001B88C97D|nr:required for excision 1-B domain-containing protein-like [Gigantopelta aegis]XP_041360376.1 required for excision 1-B domain-containing protein-like [Gigantopelta aegis]XP_041360377.1 required for excision 1-B domain-containing protein-like [Gigantopelta aegis]XP_041360378.1 required for excision 1-B domain-containing protein-like [Gigantopelta aegis]